MKLKYVTLGFVLTLVQACTMAHGDGKKPMVEDVIFEPKPAVAKASVFKMDKEKLFSNANVIYYPLNKPAGDVEQKFPEYQSVLDNTTAGGYTVFDSSVTVYSVNGTNNKPAYLPQYSVPRYAAQYEEQRMQEERMRAAQVLSPLPEMAPRPPMMLTRSADIEMRGSDVVNVRPAAKVMRSHEKNKNRRSRPLLTAYE